LAGLPRPGIVSSTQHDLAGLRRLGISTLVTLEETTTVDRKLLAQFDIALLHFPVADMGIPQVEPTRVLCVEIDRLLRAERAVALHCRAGLGRTGTLLACQLIFGRESARDAIERVRRLNPLCIQSQAQVEFLMSFEQFLLARAGASSTSTAGQTT
jgi:atypical dual specificity phosphatase